ncbi:putative glycolipid-binding domain-containing protein [Brevibacillus parabrevis]|uniref:putative glycolipid-binding domain-containing protein n=1 Tax=Brevibacillus parabrevis TaxID=54914 RepID=UPI0028D1D116|nr:putative glycolipid-binding domain-containing protein [Brevibacillus parabrevis]MED1725740.1 putative glycolipid-binding domain-containing protein [Brevibacillus parabrevis]
MLPANVIWKPHSGLGFEHLEISESNERLIFDSLVMGMNEQGEWVRTHYVIELDRKWATRKVTIRHLGKADGLCLLSDGQGEWTNAEGEPIAELAGCVDIDISCTPFTNTLPIRRLSFAPHVPQEIDVVYFSAYELTWRRVRQQYTLLSADAGSSVFEYRAGSFVENITVDEQGLVLAYPDLFVRENLAVAEAGKA